MRDNQRHIAIEMDPLVLTQDIGKDYRQWWQKYRFAVALADVGGWLLSFRDFLRDRS